MHPRRVLRSAVITRLQNDATLTNLGFTFEGSRVRPVHELAGYWGFVFTEQDRLAGDDHQTQTRNVFGGSVQELRSVALVVALLAYGDLEADVEDVLDDAAERVEVIVAADMTQGGSVEDTEYESTDPFRSAEGQTINGSQIMLWRCTYLHEYGS